MPRIATLFVLLLVLSGCANDLSPQADRVRDARSGDVQGCDMVGEVYGTADGFHWSDSHATTKARNQALEMAAEMRATHIVWDNVEGDIPTYVTGTAFRC